MSWKFTHFNLCKSLKVLHILKFFSRYLLIPPSFSNDHSIVKNYTLKCCVLEILTQSVLNTSVLHLQQIWNHSYFVLKEKKNNIFLGVITERKNDLSSAKVKTRLNHTPLLAPQNYSIFLKFQQSAFISITLLNFELLFLLSFPPSYK